MSPRSRSILVWTLALFAGWSMLALLFIPQSYLGAMQRGGTAPPLRNALVGQLPMFWSWAVLTPFVVWLGRRLPIEPPRRARHLTVYFVAAFFFAGVHLVIAGFGHQLAGWALTGVWRPRRPLYGIAISYGATNVMICWGILAGSQALTYFRRYQDRELRLVEAQLQSLKTQLHPHFLFNTLNAIAELIHQDSARAERTVTQLSELLRTALNRGQTDSVPLKDEIDFLRNYVDIQQTLLQERLLVLWNISDDVLDEAVPEMLLQPLVENAIQHGIGPRARGGTLHITAERAGARLRLEVADDGLGVDDALPADGGGIGLSNTRARLRHLYGDKFEMSLNPRPGGGTVAQILLPLSKAAPPSVST